MRAFKPGSRPADLPASQAPWVATRRSADEELRAGGHEVTGLARSDEGAAMLAEWGVEVRRGDVADPDGLAEGARASDGVIHCAFGHDFSRYVEMGDADLRAVSAMAEALAGSGKPLIVTSGMTAGVVGRASTE
ncbi:MAG TPA: NAD(P)H-binding protein, partial [Caulobacteraceae bacterium]|nr:NAD(P)H-binding protein [Caulobacteraceae bacterium]